MIKQYLQPTTVAEAIALKAEHGEQAFFLGGGSKANATPTKVVKPVAIATSGLNLSGIDTKDGALVLGAGTRLQSLLDHADVPTSLKAALRFIYSRHIRNQATLGGEIAAVQPERRLIPALVALQAQLELMQIDGQSLRIDMETYLQGQHHGLITAVILPEPEMICVNEQVTRSAAGLAVLTAAVSLPSGCDHPIMVIDGMAEQPLRLRDVETQGLADEALETAVADAIHPVEDLRGSVEYKKYIAGVVIADLLAQAQQEK